MNSTKPTIPPIDRAEWVQIVTGKLDYKFSNFVLQMKSHFYAQSIQEGEMDVSAAVEELYFLCEKYSLAINNDLKKIFKEW